MADAELAGRRKWTFRRALMPTLAAVAAGLLVLLLGRLLIVAREEARFTQCRNNLKQVMLALHNYHDTHGSFPPAVVYGPGGKPWHSWRVLLVPFLESSRFYSRYRLDEPWDGPNNRKLREEHDSYAKQFGWVLHCPSDPSDGTHTSYMAVIGKRTMWPPDRGARRDDATDGTESVIAVVEVSESGVHWMEPRDLGFDEMRFDLSGTGEGIRSGHRESRWLLDAGPRANAAFVDGSVQEINSDVRPEDLRSMLVRDDGGPNGGW